MVGSCFELGITSRLKGCCSEVAACCGAIAIVLHTAQEIDEKSGIIRCLNGLGWASYAQEEYQEAKIDFYAAVRTAAEAQLLPEMLDALIGIGVLLACAGEQERGLKLLILGQSHPATHHETKVRARRLLAAYSWISSQKCPPPLR